MKKEINDFVEFCGGTTQAAERVGVTRQYMFFLRTGQRRASPQLARKIDKATDGKITKESLIWGAT